MRPSRTRPVVLDGLDDLGLLVHHEGAVAGHGLAQGLTAHEKEAIRVHED